MNRKDDLTILNLDLEELSDGSFKCRQKLYVGVSVLVTIVIAITMDIGEFLFLSVIVISTLLFCCFQFTFHLNEVYGNLHKLVHLVSFESEIIDTLKAYKKLQDTLVLMNKVYEFSMKSMYVMVFCIILYIVTETIVEGSFSKSKGTVQHF